MPAEPASPDLREARREPAGLLAALAAGLLALPVVWTPAGLMDEVTYLSHGLRVLAGQVPYRDFFEFLGPLAAWLPAAVALVAGPSVAGLRLATAAALALAAWLAYLAARGLGCGRALATLPGLALAGVLYGAVPGYSHHWIPTPFYGLAVLAALHGADPDRPRLGAWAIAGAATALLGLVLHLDGVAAGAALVAWLAIDAAMGGATPAVAARRAAALAAGAAGPTLLAAMPLAAAGALGAAYEHMVVWTLTHYKVAGHLNDVRFPMDLGWVLSTQGPGFKLWKWYLHAATALYAYLLPVLALGLAALGGWDLLRARLAGGRPWTPATGRLALAGLLALAAFAALLRGKADWVHVCYYLAPTLLFMAALAARFQAAWPGGRAIAAGPALSLAAFVVVGVAGATAELWTDPRLRPAAGGPDAAMAADPAAVWLRAQARPGDRLAVYPLGPQWHVYALPPATRFTTMLHPNEGYYDQADWDRFWGEVAARKPRFVMLGPLPRTPAPPPVPLVGYREAARFDLDYMGAPRRCWIYEREAGASP